MIITEKFLILLLRYLTEKIRKYCGITYSYYSFDIQLSYRKINNKKEYQCPDCKGPLLIRSNKNTKHFILECDNTKCKRIIGIQVDVDSNNHKFYKRYNSNKFLTEYEVDEKIKKAFELYSIGQSKQQKYTKSILGGLCDLSQTQK